MTAGGDRGGGKGLGPKTPSTAPGGKKQRLGNNNNNNSSHPYGVLQFTRTTFSYLFICNETRDSLAWEAQDSKECVSRLTVVQHLNHTSCCLSQIPSIKSHSGSNSPLQS